jgi:LysR family glycine cleavage system transcriptional activator
VPCPQAAQGPPGPGPHHDQIAAAHLGDRPGDLGHGPRQHLGLELPGDGPDLLQEQPRHDLLAHGLFFEVDKAHWQQWFQAAGVDVAGGFEAVQMDDPHALRQVVLDGHGFGLFYAELIHEDVRTGKLVQPFDLGVDPGCAYYLNRPRDTPVSAKLQIFTRWILEEVARRAFA